MLPCGVAEGSADVEFSVAALARGKTSSLRFSLSRGGCVDKSTTDVRILL
jgi:hypothetical protein